MSIRLRNSINRLDDFIENLSGTIITSQPRLMDVMYPVSLQVWVGILVAYTEFILVVN